MPNTGQVLGQAFKCEKCRKHFKKTWLPTNLCCRIKLNEDSVSAVYSSSYSRHLSPAKTDRSSSSTESSSTKSAKSKKSTSSPPTKRFEPGIKLQRLSDPRFRYVNSLAPFSTLGKATCGYYFADNTDHKKYKTGIPPSDLVAWRSHISWENPEIFTSKTQVCDGIILRFWNDLIIAVVMVAWRDSCVDEPKKKVLWFRLCQKADLWCQFNVSEKLPSKMDDLCYCKLRTKYFVERLENQWLVS